MRERKKKKHILYRSDAGERMRLITLHLVKRSVSRPAASSALWDKPYRTWRKGASKTFRIKLFHAEYIYKIWREYRDIFTFVSGIVRNLHLWSAKLFQRDMPKGPLSQVHFKDMDIEGRCSRSLFHHQERSNWSF